MAKGMNKAQKRAFIEAKLAEMRKNGTLNPKFSEVSVEEVAQASEGIEALALLLKEAQNNFKLAYIDNHPFGGEFKVSSVSDQGFRTVITSTSGKVITLPPDGYKNLRNQAYMDNFASVKTLLSQMSSNRLGILKEGSRQMFQLSLGAPGEFSYCFEAEVSGSTMRKFEEAFKGRLKNRAA